MDNHVVDVVIKNFSPVLLINPSADFFFPNFFFLPELLLKGCIHLGIDDCLKCLDVVFYPSPFCFM